ncbi:uncharacterized protein LOC112898180 [Panicum hallii]|uniref:uncharacterized protein LOC112898180 n=1 Tax=Panicum hallii TaxID=206008 RepID=UPI000DF4EE6C|nr:uncharacterized protein LOC112898180 [Panicum hallii]
MDVKFAFLNGDLKEIYVHQPPGFVIPGKEGKVLRFAASAKDDEFVAFKEEMKAAFQMSDLGPLSFYLGIKVHQDDSGISLRQTGYAKRIVELGWLTDCNPSLTPMEERLKRSCDSTVEEVDATKYRRLHLQAVKRIICYVAGTLDYGLHYPRCPCATHFIGYSDSDHAGDIDMSKSTNGTMFFLGKCLRCRSSGAPGGQHVALALAKKPVFHERSKHIRVKYHFVRGCLEDGSVKANYISTQDQLADFHAKSLGRVKFQELRSRIGMIKIP